MRDDFPMAVKETLARRVGVRCSNPQCRKPTSGPQEDPSQAVNIGVAAHITAASPGGPRYDSSLSPEERRSTTNAIWLCQNCAKLVDNDENRYPIDILRDWKTQSEEGARQALETNPPSSAQVMPQMDKWKKSIREISYCLGYYARWYGNIGSGHLNDMKKAYDALQQCAHRLVASAQAMDYPISRSHVEEIKKLLIGISNTLIDGNILYMQQNPGYVPDPEESRVRRIQSRENLENAERIKHLLGLSQ
jgi:hypothetical protein